VFVLAYAVATVAATLGLITGFNETRRTRSIGSLVRAKSGLLAWRIAGVEVGRYFGPILVADGDTLDLPTGMGAQLLPTALALGAVIGVILVDRHYRRRARR